MQIYNQDLALKLHLKIVAYTNRNRINIKIGSACMIQKFLGVDTYSKVYMRKLQGIHNFLNYIISLGQSLGLSIFTNSQAALQAFKN